VYTGFMPKIKQIKAYQTMFQKAFPPGGEITHVHMARAIAAFQRTLVSEDSPFDRYLRGDRIALSPAAKRGLELFSGKAGCTACHSGALLTDWGFHHIGLRSDDPGRGAHVHADAEKQRFYKTFRTPPLRNVGLTAPYMHDGSLGTLEAVVAFYDRGGDDATHRSPLIHPLGYVWSSCNLLHKHGLMPCKINKNRHLSSAALLYAHGVRKSLDSRRCFNTPF
jgi:cytochrome c peroxidase